ncbi:MAG: methyltransferase domain-containing protein [Acidimicrobiia bacterium]|nr:methyltransferase domain-containing protein [Acidimicrobiia bacterium]MDX2466550.1 methyltransferase domain-containing protein [Acidimicrobiia bacterium]
MSAKDEFYTHGHDPVVVGSHAQRSAVTSAAFLLPHLLDGTRLLDFGCGPGSITVDLGHHVAPTGSVVGLDSNAEVVEIAAREAAGPGVSYLRSSVYDIPMADEAFDVAYGHQILQHLGDPVAALGEIYRVLDRGGIVGVRDADFGSMTHHPHYPEIDAWLEVYHGVARANGGEPDAGRRLPEWVRQAGFIQPTITTSTWTYARPDERLAWAELWAKRISLPRFADKAEELGLADRATIGALADAWISWGHEPDGWFSFIHGEVIAYKPG